MDTMKGLESQLNQLEEDKSKQEDIYSFVSQLMNERVKEEAKKGDLPSNMVVNPKNLNDMDLAGGVQVESIPYFDEEEHEPQECQEVNSRIR